jgi:hypothetical protein
MKIVPPLALAIVLTGLLLPVLASADCTHRDFRDKQIRLAGAIARERAQDPAAADALQSRARAVAGAAAGDDKVGLSQACGELDDMLLEADKPSG